MPVDNFEALITAFRRKLDADILAQPLEVEWSKQQLEAIAMAAGEWAARQAEHDPEWRGAPKAAIFALTEGVTIGALCISEALREVGN